MNRHLLKDLADMVKTDTISEETALKIREYYRHKQPEAQKQLFVIFGILGAILVGLGLILMLAHNWENMNRGMQTLLALLPLFGAQGLCLYVLLRKPEPAWREGSSAFLFFAVGASIALVGQIYNVPGTISGFLLTWSLLCLPIMYVMQASIASVLYILIISYYGLSKNYGVFDAYGAIDYWYWILLPLGLPYYYLLRQKSQGGSFLIFHHWLLPFSVMLMLGHLLSDGDSDWRLLYPLYAALFGFYYQFGQTSFTKGSNGYIVIGSLGGIVMLTVGSFHDFWFAIYHHSSEFYLPVAGLIAMSALVGTALGILVSRYRKDVHLEFDPFNFSFLAYLLITFIATMAGGVIPSVVCNILVAAIGIATIREGVKTDSLGALNYGLLIVSVLIICRFFDIDLSFFVRGFLFILIGIGFFIANSMMIRKKG